MPLITVIAHRIMNPSFIGSSNVSTITTSTGRPKRKYRLTTTWANGLKTVIDIRWQERHGHMPPTLRVSCEDPSVTVAITLAFPQCTINLHTTEWHARMNLLLPPQDANRVLGIDSDELYYSDSRSYKAVDRVWAVPSWVVPASLA